MFGADHIDECRLHGLQEDIFRCCPFLPDVVQVKLPIFIDDGFLHLRVFTLISHLLILLFHEGCALHVELFCHAVHHLSDEI